MNSLIKELGENGVDLEVTLSRFLGDEEFYIECLYTFLEDKSVEGLKKALKTKDYDQAFHYAHTLKGVLSNLGLEKIYKKASNLVEALRTENYSDLEVMAEDIYSEYNDFVKILERNR